MANICDVTYKCIGDEKQLKELHDIIDSLEPGAELHDLVKALGGDAEYGCRGCISDFRLGEGILTIHQETAWSEQSNVRETIEKKFPGVKVYYQAEEPGCGYYVTNDREGTFFTDRFCSDIEGPGLEYFENIGQAAGYIGELVGHTVGQTMDEVTEAYEELRMRDSLDWCSIHEFETEND